MTIEGDHARITLDAQTGADATDRRYLNGLPTTATLTDPYGVDQQVTLPQVAPGRYETLVPVADDGIYALNVSQTNPDGSVANQSSGFVVPYSPEYRVLGSNEGLLDRLAKRTGGRLITDPAQAFVHDLPSVAAPRPLWPALMVASALLFVLDVAVRRLRITAPELRAGYYAVRRRLGYVDSPRSLAGAQIADLAHGRATDMMVPRGLVAREAMARLRQSSAPAPRPDSRTSRLLAAKQRAARR